MTAPQIAHPLVREKHCERCAQRDYSRRKRADGLRHRPTTAVPSIEQLQDWSSDCVAEATDGCEVEPDGVCEHGHTSWMRVLGFI